jgi:hypothetical protein
VDAENALEAEQAKITLKVDLESCETSDGRLTVIAPIHSEAPLHWTLLIGTKEGSQPEVNWKYIEPLKIDSKSATVRAQVELNRLQESLGADKTALPQKSNTQFQKDGWSCGLWVLAYSQQAISTSQGQPPRSVIVDFHRVIDRTNRWIQTLQNFQLQLKNKSGTSGIPAVPPPLPPPSQPPQTETLEEMLAKVVTAKKPAQPLAVEDRYGCSRCRGSRSGCLQCNPSKALRYHRKKPLHSI